MSIKKVIVFVFSYFACAVAGTLATFGLIFTVWFFFFSKSEYSLFWGSGSILVVYLGYIIHRAAFPYI